MRYLKRREQAVSIRAPGTVTDAVGTKTKGWTGTLTSAKGDVQPLSSSKARAEYGERADRMLQVFLPNGTYNIGDGVWIGSENTSVTPPWVIVSVAAWQTMTMLTIEKR